MNPKPDKNYDLVLEMRINDINKDTMQAYCRYLEFGFALALDVDDDGLILIGDEVGA